MYLSYSKNGEFKQVYVPKQWQQRVQQWVSQYKDARDLLEEISDMYLKRISERKE
jgi:hypothetical protein